MTRTLRLALVSTAIIVGLSMGCRQAATPIDAPAAPDPVSDAVRRATELTNAGKHAEALAAIEPAASQTPASLRVLSLRGRIRLALTTYGEATEDFAGALKAASDDTPPADLCQAHLGLAEAYAGLGRVSEAESEFERAAAADPAHRDEVQAARERLVGVVRTCGVCKGEGVTGGGGSWGSSSRCNICGGSGGYSYTYASGTNRLSTTFIRCSACSGTGSDTNYSAPRPSSTCWNCSGRGQVRVKSER